MRRQYLSKVSILHILFITGISSLLSVSSLIRLTVSVMKLFVSNCNCQIVVSLHSYSLIYRLMFVDVIERLET